MNPPAISSLNESLAVKQNFINLGQRLSLSLNCHYYTGTAEFDCWVKNARTFKTEAYGITEFGEDAEES